ncbi:MAG: GNAT family N-acetyltransferase, partial [Promethearchaeota archaeon]
MPIKYRTFQDGDEPGIDKLFHSAFCQTRFCQPRTIEFWEWKYKKRPPRFIPEGIMLAEKNGIIVGSVIVTFHKMRFGDNEFLFGGIDDVATCPILEKRGIARNLMERAIEFTKDYGAEASVLMADPRGHARRLYKKLGYIYKTYYSLFTKINNPLKFKNEILPIFPFFPLFYLMKLKAKRKKKETDIQFEIQKGEQQEFIKKINEHNKNFIGGNTYDKAY